MKYVLQYDSLDSDVCDRRLASVPITIEVVKISIPRGLFLTSIIQLRYKNRMCYTLILDLKILVQFFFSCIISHLICLWSITSFSAFYFNVICKIHIEGYFSHFLHSIHFNPWNLFESFKLVCISPCFNLMSKFISKISVESFFSQFSP